MRTHHELTRRCVALTLAGALALAGMGCSTFNADWQAACSGMWNPNGIEGPWEGTWKSKVGKESGAIRVIVTRQSDGTYLVRKRTTHSMFIHAEETIPVEIVEDGPPLRFDGETDMGALSGGKLKYTGAVEDGEFSARYRYKYDNGVETLTRPAR